MNFFRRRLSGDESLFESVQELVFPKTTELETYSAICWDMYGLPDGTINPTHHHLSRGHLLMRPPDLEINAAFNKILSKMLPRDKQWLIQIPRRIANLNAIDARIYLSPQGRAAIVLPRGAFGGLFFLNELFHSLSHEHGLPEELEDFVSRSLPQLLAKWILCEDSDKLASQEEEMQSITILLAARRRRWQQWPEERSFIWATTVIQQLFILLHEFGHLVNADINHLKKNLSHVRSLSFHGSDSEIKADAWALSCISKGIDGICDARSEHLEQSLFLLVGVLHFLRQNGYFSDFDGDIYEQRWLQITRTIDPIGNDYTISMNRQLLSMFKDFYMGNTNRYSPRAHRLEQFQGDEPIDRAVEWNDKGCDYIEEDDLRNAVSCFKKAIEIFPGYAEAYCNLANCYDNLGLFDQAIEMYETATRCVTDPDRMASIWENMSIAYMRNGNRQKAIECSQRAKHS